MAYLSEDTMKKLEAHDFFQAQTDDMIRDRAAIAEMIQRFALILGKIDHELQTRMEMDRGTKAQLTGTGIRLCIWSQLPRDAQFNYRRTDRYFRAAQSTRRVSSKRSMASSL